jgi:HEAT repeat protein
MAEHAGSQDLTGLLADLASGDSQRAETAALELPLRGEAALAALTPLLNHKEDDRRWWAVRSLAGFQQPAAGELLSAALGDGSLSVQQCAALGLAKRPHAPAAGALIGLLRSPDSLLARLAGDALAALGAAAVEPLIAALDEDGPLPARVEAARALALIGDTRAVPALFRLLGSDSTLLEHWAGEGLEKMGVGMAFFKP